jgi:hypothetical protein
VQYAFVREFGIAVGASYSAFLQNLLMSVLFRHAGEKGKHCRPILIDSGQQVDWNPAPTILYGILGEGAFPRGSFLILITGLLCSVFDLVYIYVLAKFMAAGRTASS